MCLSRPVILYVIRHVISSTTFSVTVCLVDDWQKSFVVYCFIEIKNINGSICSLHSTANVLFFDIDCYHSTFISILRNDDGCACVRVFLFGRYGRCAASVPTMFRGNSPFGNDSISYADSVQSRCGSQCLSAEFTERFHLSHYSLAVNLIVFFLSVCRGHSRFSMMDDESVQSSIISRPSAKSIYCELTWFLNWCQTVSNMEIK